MRTFAIILALFCCSYLNAIETQGISQSKRHKIKADISRISFENDGMYYSWNGCSFKIPSIEFEDGEYKIIVRNDILEDIFGIWFCKHCEKMNTRFETVCSSCKKPR